ncbi:MAG: ATP-binding protein [Gammaproteobacteria bacterium]
MFQLRRYFLLTGGAAFIAFTLIFALGVYNRDMANLERIGERENIILAGFLANALQPQIEQYLASSKFDENYLRQAEVRSQIDDVLNDFSNSYAILKVKIFKPDGITLYSTKKDEIGIQKTGSSAITDAYRSSKTTSIMVLKGTFETLSGELLNRDIVETYIPIKSVQGDVIAIFELYSDVTDLVKQARKALYRDFLLLVIGYLTLFLLIYFIVRRADGIIKHQYAELDEVNKKLEYANENLENAVDERTRVLRKTIDQLNAEINDRRAAQNANQAKSEFLSSMSHELRTPLNAIIGFSQILEISENLDEEDQDNVKEINKAGHHLLSLINEILDLSKIEAGKMELSIEKVEPESLVLECVSLIQPFATKHDIELDYAISTDRAVSADYTRLKQSLLNLLSNAIKYNKENGQVNLNICANQQGDKVLFEVKDTGNGLSKQQIDELFEPFKRLNAKHSSIEGTGIGLTITRKIVELMHGAISVESQLGQGSVFTIEMPVLSQGSANASPEPDSAPAETENDNETDDSSKRFKVLYIEDNPANIKLISRVMAARNNIDLQTAHLPELGLEYASKHQHDLVLLDINMPGMDGYEVLKRLKADPKTSVIPVFAVTANAMPKDIERGKQAGFDEYLTKPLDIPAFYQMIDAYLK